MDFTSRLSRVTVWAVTSILYILAAIGVVYGHFVILSWAILVSFASLCIVIFSIIYLYIHMVELHPNEASQDATVTEEYNHIRDTILDTPIPNWLIAIADLIVVAILFSGGHWIIGSYIWLSVFAEQHIRNHWSRNSAD